MDAIGKIGFIGGGQMALAVASGFVKSGLIDPSNIHISNRTEPKLQKFSDMGIHTTTNNMEVFDKCQVIVLAIKPQVFPTIINEVKEKQKLTDIDCSSKLFVSVMGPVPISTITDGFGIKSKVVRTLPNTPCLVGAGTILYCRNEFVSDESYAQIIKLLQSCAEAIECPEDLIDAGSGVMGCSPAFFFTAIDALADGGVKMGLPRAMAIKLASRALYGAGKLAVESDKHPCELRDAVASPGGTTICGLHSLEQSGFRAAWINAVETTVLRAKELAKQ